jgi:hypothetical protein
MRISSLVMSVFLWGALPVRAHPADMIGASMERLENGVVVATLTFTENTLAAWVPSAVPGHLPEPTTLEAAVWDSVPIYSGEVRCELKQKEGTLKEGVIRLEARATCPSGRLKQVFEVLSLLPSGYSVVFDGKDRDQTLNAFAVGNEQTVMMPDPTRPASTRFSFVRWIALGIEHIWVGADHLAFLTALLVAAHGWRQLGLIVTSFTLAHSLTLSAAALGWIALVPSLERAAEIGIAFSIVFVAVVNFVAPRGVHRAGAAFIFGLVHGFGFASVLQGYLSQSSVLPGLLGFNLGVELGQALVVALLYPLVLVARRQPYTERWLVRVSSIALAGAGAYWMMERVLS